MSQKYNVPNLTTRQIVLPSDDCIGPEGDYMAYADTGDESHLHLTGSPTRWEVRALDDQLLVKISQQTNWPPETLGRAMGDPDWAACAVRNLVCGVSGLSKDWPRPVMVWEAGRKVLSWEIVEGLRAGDSAVAARNLQTICLAGIALKAEMAAIVPK